MGLRGPKPKTNMHVLPAPKTKRKSPMPGMTKPARRIWTRVVNAYPPDHFKPQHYGMLKAYCEEEATHSRAIKAIEKSGDLIKQSNGVVKENPYIGIKVKAFNGMSQLATKLGITVNATTVTRHGEKGSSKPKSKRDGLLYKG